MNTTTQAPAGSACTCLNRFDRCQHCRAVKAAAVAQPAAVAKAPAPEPKAKTPRPVRPEATPAALPPLAERWLSPKEAAALLGVGVRTLWRLVEENRMPQPVRYSRKLVRFSGAKLAAWMRQEADDAQQAG